VNAPRRGIGVALIVVSAACFAGLDTTTRYLGAYLPVLLLLWSRYAFQAVVMAVWLVRSRAHGFRAAHPRFQVLRGRAARHERDVVLRRAVDAGARIHRHRDSTCAVQATNGR
jgi:hypothetical protein